MTIHLKQNYSFLQYCKPLNNRCKYRSFLIFFFFLYLSNRKKCSTEDVFLKKNNTWSTIIVVHDL